MTTPTSIQISARNLPERADLETFVRDCFAMTWGAQVTEFMPWLLGLRDDAGALQGVLGLRPAENGELFLEQYLDEPVEHLLSRVTGEGVERDGLVEVGNLASSHPGGARWLITALTAYLHAGGRSWVVFTGGPILQNAFSRLGLELLVLGPADPARLRGGSAHWGRYYEQRPMVMAGRVDYGFERLSRLFTAECALYGLWEAASRCGVGGL